eukprot:scaffold9646_cov133-Cylindrotheca_fusiformis.AAC.1
MTEETRLGPLQSGLSTMFESNAKFENDVIRRVLQTRFGQIASWWLIALDRSAWKSDMIQAINATLEADWSFRRRRERMKIDEAILYRQWTNCRSRILQNQ